MNSKLYPTHIPTTGLQKAMLAVGSAATAILAPWRGDAVACMGETTAQWTLPLIKRKMQTDPEGALVLMEKPRIRDCTVDVGALRCLADGTFGREYARFLDHLETSPDARPPVQFVDDLEAAYVMMRYRETHDLFHTVLGMPTHMLGEVMVKWFEGIQFGLPMCVLGGLFGAFRLYAKQRASFRAHFPWIVRNAENGRFLMSVYWEHYWEMPLVELRKKLNLEEPPTLFRK
uniref:Ubiquinone biosynthesis protein COQ4 homolog, mitochondrial n=1 Tax=Trichuris muris TaxID=70415 RepID=A0A5S6QV70_TRIMR